MLPTDENGSFDHEHPFVTCRECGREFWPFDIGFSRRCAHCIAESDEWDFPIRNLSARSDDDS